MWPLLLLLLLTLSPGSGLAQGDPIEALKPQSWPVETRNAESGLRIWQYPSADAGAFRLLILVGVGSRDEQPGEAGISHYLEHCLFLSTQKRSEKELIQGLRKHRGEHNGQTTEDWTAYWVSLPASQWRYGVDWLCELLAKPRFDAEEISREKRIVIEEIRTRHGHGGAPTFETILYGDHPLGRSIAGTDSSVQAVDRETLEGWYRKNYRLDNLVVAFAGEVPAEECNQRIQKQLASMESGSGIRAEQELHPRVGPSLMRSGLRRSGDRRGFLLLGYHIEPGPASDLASLLLAKELLDDLVFDEIRSKRGLAYAPAADLTIHDAIWRLDCRIDVGERNSLPSVLEGTRLAFSALSSTSREDFDRAQTSVLNRLHVSGMNDLKRCVELTWALLGAKAPPDLRRAVLELDPDRFAASIPRLLAKEHEFLISDSVDIVSPALGLFWIFIASLAAIAGLIWWLPRRLRRGRARHRAPLEGSFRQRPPAPATPTVPEPKEGDGEELARQLEDWYREQDEKGPK